MDKALHLVEKARAETDRHRAFLMLKQANRILKQHSSEHPQWDTLVEQMELTESRHSLPPMDTIFEHACESCHLIAFEDETGGFSPISADVYYCTENRRIEVRYSDKSGDVFHFSSLDLGAGLAKLLEMETATGVVLAARVALLIAKDMGIVYWACPKHGHLALADSGEHHLCEECDAWWFEDEYIDEDFRTGGEGGPPYDAATATGMYDRD